MAEIRLEADYQKPRRARRRAGLTIKQVAVKMGVDFSTVYRWEVGFRTISLGDAKRLAALYGTTPGKIFLSLDKTTRFGKQI